MAGGKSVSEIARITGRNRRTIRRLIHQGVLRPLRDLLEDRATVRFEDATRQAGAGGLGHPAKAGVEAGAGLRAHPGLVAGQLPRFQRDAGVAGSAPLPRARLAVSGWRPLEEQEVAGMKPRRTPTSRAEAASTWHYLLARRQEVEAFSTQPAVDVVQRDMARAAALAGERDAARLERLAAQLRTA